MSLPPITRHRIILRRSLRRIHHGGIRRKLSNAVFLTNLVRQTDNFITDIHIGIEVNRVIVELAALIAGAAGVSRGAAGRRNGDGAGRTTDADNDGAERTIRFIGLEEVHNHSTRLVALDHDTAGIHINPDKANVGRMVIKTIAVLDIDAKDFAGAIGHLKVSLLANGNIDLKVGAKSTNSLRLVLSSYISAGIGLGRTVGLRRSLGGGIGFRATGSELILVAIEHHDGLCAGQGGVRGEVGLIHAIDDAVGIRPVDSGAKLRGESLHIAERSGRGGLAVNALIAGVVINHRAELSTADGRVTEELIRARDSRNQDVILLRPACSVCVVDGGLHIRERGSAAHGRLAGITVENSGHLAAQGLVVGAEGRGGRAVHDLFVYRPCDFLGGPEGIRDIRKERRRRGHAADRDCHAEGEQDTSQSFHTFAVPFIVLPGADRPANFGSKTVESCRLPQKSLIRQSRKVNHEIRKMADLPVKFPSNYVVGKFRCQNRKAASLSHLDGCSARWSIARPSSAMFPPEATMQMRRHEP